MKKKLIVTAHDFGMLPCVNEGIMYCLKHKNNIITEVSLLANYPGSAEAAKMIKDFPVSVSLSSNFTTRKPVAKNVPSLVGKDGNFRKVYTENWDFSAIDLFDEEDIRRELDAQWGWFVAHVGRKPSAILSQKNEYGDPKILVPVVDKAKKEKVAMRTPVWQWRENYGAHSYVEQEGVKATQSIFMGLVDWKGKFGYDLENNVDTLIRDINKKPGVSELLVFPGFVDEDLFNSTSLNWQRGLFVKLISNDEAIGKIKKNFDLISFKDI